ncbi:spore coat CotO family protein [Bacillus sp. sid0103]|uniref:CotO family spore coat protein n=1 Tax=Bacillaceae TaxID=186817 RepID=UPI001C475CB0|nr:CotO family spore coat protein [Bacillus sp. sid0103]MBV7508495.1 spore coat CotO family protein [Bacillus sp. sid0103]
MSKKMSKGPLLYIHQPFSRPPATNMQETYTIKQELIEQEEENPSEEEGKKKLSLAKQELVPEQIKKGVKKEENSSPTRHMKSLASPTQFQDKKRTSLNRVKPFKQMNLGERLDYLLNYPKALPPAPCVFVTEENSYQGYLMEYDGQNVTIRFHDQTTKSVPVHALKNVMLIGIRK